MRSASGWRARLALRLDDRRERRDAGRRFRDPLWLRELLRDRLRCDAPLLRDRLEVGIGALLRWG